jgi:hypothetical protein
MRNKPYVAVAAVPAALLLWWAVSLWWRDNAIGAVIAGAIAVAMFVAAYRIAQADSFSPTKRSNWNSSRSAEVNRWATAHDEKDDRPAAKP